MESLKGDFFCCSWGKLTSDLLKFVVNKAADTDFLRNFMLFETALALVAIVATLFLIYYFKKTHILRC